MSDLANRPIYPCQELNGQGQPIMSMEFGITLRQHYAGLAMQGLLAHGVQRKETGEAAYAEWYAKTSVHIADALIAELSK